MQELYRECLQEKLAERCAGNPRYSLRSFARALQVDAGTLSRLLAGKQVPSPKLADKLMQGLSLSPREQALFLKSVAEKQSQRQRKKLGPTIQALDTGATADLSLEIYRAISDWYHFAILELTYVEGFQSSRRWIASQLGISPLEAQLAVERLIKLGLLRSEGGRLRKTDEQLTSADKHLTDPALRKQQRQFLEKALHSLENDPLESRNMSSMTMAIDPKKLPLAKTMIRDFNRSLCAALESGARKRVYNLEIALYPLQKEPPKKGKVK